MIRHSEITQPTVFQMIKQNLVKFGGHRSLRIYGTLGCRSGKKMKKENRVFFFSERDAIMNGFRPCGHCMRSEYKKWKNGII